MVLYYIQKVTLTEQSMFVDSYYFSREYFLYANTCFSFWKRCYGKVLSLITFILCLWLKEN